jgi:hypothetical protein
MAENCRSVVDGERVMRIDGPVDVVVVRIEAVSDRCWTRITRHNTVEFTVGREFEVEVVDAVCWDCEWLRGTEMVGLDEDFGALGVVRLLPMMEAMMLAS